MLEGYGCNLSIGCCRGLALEIAVAHQAPPNGRRGTVERQDAPFKLSGQVLLDPSFKSFATRCFLYLPCASHQFPDGLCCEEKVRRGLGLNPVDHSLLRSWPDRLADNIGVEEKGH